MQYEHVQRMTGNRRQKQVLERISQGERKTESLMDEGNQGSNIRKRYGRRAVDG
jgi:hypothetical protein